MSTTCPNHPPRMWIMNTKRNRRKYNWVTIITKLTNINVLLKYNKGRMCSHTWSQESLYVRFHRLVNEFPNPWSLGLHLYRSFKLLISRLNKFIRVWFITYGFGHDPKFLTKSWNLVSRSPLIIREVSGYLMHGLICFTIIYIKSIWPHGYGALLWAVWIFLPTQIITPINRLETC